MLMVNIFEIKAKLSEYLERVAAGEQILICRHNKPVAELRAVAGVRTDPRPIGPLKGRPTFDLAPGFFEPMSEPELELWEGVAGSDPVETPWPAQAPSSRGTARVAEPKTPHGTRRRPARKRQRS